MIRSRSFLKLTPLQLGASVLTTLALWLCFPAASTAQRSGERWEPLGPDYGGVYALKRDPFNPGALIAALFSGARIEVGTRDNRGHRYQECLKGVSCSRSPSTPADPGPCI